MKKVFISTTSFAKDDPRPLDILTGAGLEVRLNPHGRKLTEDEMISLIADSDFLIAGTESLTKKVLRSAVKLKIISRCGVGLDNIDLEFAGRSGIKVCNTPDAPTLSVAELTVGMMLGLLRHIPAMSADVKRGKWDKRTGGLLKGKRIGIVGFGRIGHKVAELLIPFGAVIAYSDINDVNTKLPCRKMPLSELLGWSDIVTIHCSAPKGSGPIIGKEEMEKMKKGSWLINTSRGGLIDEDALCASLKSGKISGAALDVFEKEPYAGPLKDLDNVILTPHIGSYAKEARIEMEIQAARNLLDACGKRS